MWNYRIIKKDESYGLYEVIYNEEKQIAAHSENPELESHDVDDLIESLEMMLEDAKKCKNNILEYNQIQFAPLYDENEELIEIDGLDDLLKYNGR
jgi:metal-responsive CopG/Arc/MetJ family transcriptional regulator